MDTQHKPSAKKDGERGKAKILKEVVFSDNAAEVYEYLKVKAPNSKIERSILKAIDRKIKLIKANPRHGRDVPKYLIPREYRTALGVKKLFRVELPNYWRMLYTLLDDNDRLMIIAFVLDILDHKQYNKKFGYKG